MSFLEEMTSLGENLLHAAQNRKGDVGAIIGSTQRFLGNTRRAQHENAKKERQFLGKFTDSLSKFVDDFSRNTQTIMSGFHKRHREMAKKQSHSLSEFNRKNCEGVGSFLEKCHKERMKFRGTLDQAHKNFTRSMREIEKLHGKKPSGYSAKGDGEFTKPGKNPSRGPRRTKKDKRHVS